MGIYDREYYRGETRGSLWISGTAPVCQAIIVINIAVFVVEHYIFRHDATITTWFSATSEGVFRHGYVWQLLTCTFLHADPYHILGNMLFLWVVGREIEAMYGSRDFLALYLSAAVVSTLGWAICDALSNPSGVILGSGRPVVGASGAVLALVVLYTLYYPRREVLFMFVVPVEMWVLVMGYLAYQFFLVLSGDDFRTAVEGHLSGAAYGYLFKRFDLRWSHLPLPWRHARRPRFRLINPEPRDLASPRSGSAPGGSGPVVSGMTWSSEPATSGVSKPSTTAVVSEEQLDARLDEVLAKIAREGRAGLTEEENRVLQEASRRARNRRSGLL